MSITDWDRLDGKPSAEEFRRQHAEQANLSLEEFDRYLVVEPEGDNWIAVPRTLVKREQREARK
jgi:hypothetical protein